MIVLVEFALWLFLLAKMLKVIPPLQPVYYTRPLEALAYQHGARILYILSNRTLCGAVETPPP